MDMITTAIDFAYHFNKALGEEEDQPFIEDPELNYRIPIWDDMTTQQQVDALEYVYENPNDEDFGHSGCCTAVHQATAYYCIKLMQSIDTEFFFDDLDFMMAEDVRDDPQIQSMFGISEDF